MKNRVISQMFWSAVTAGVLALPAFSVFAADIARYDYQGAGAVCQPTASQYEVGLRSRPLGLANEGTSDAFVSCALQGNDFAAGRLVTRVDILVANSGSTGAKRISCTLVAAPQTGSAFYSSRTVVPGPGQASFMTWEPSDPAIDGGTKIGIPRPALICNLPPSSVLQYTALYYREGIGS